jgi:hypothetical protein
VEGVAPGDFDPMLSSSTTTVLAPADEGRLRPATRPEPFRALANAGRRLVARVAEQVGKLRQPGLRRSLALLQSRAHWPRRRDDRGRSPGRRTLEPDQAREAADEWRSVLCAIREEATEASRLKEEFRADLAEVERIRLQLKDAYPLAIDLSSRAAVEKIQELESIRSERDGLREEARGLRWQLETQATEARERCAHLAEERDSARAERDRWNAERAAIGRELELTRDISGAERDALGREIDQLQSRLGELERSLDEAACEHQSERATWEARRKDVEEGAGRQRRALNEAEGRLLQQLAGFEAERQFWRRTLDEYDQRIQQLQRDVAMSDQLRTAVEAERDEARAAHGERERTWQAERDRLVAALERAREAAEAAAMALRPRPQACSSLEPEAFRSQLERWLAEACGRLQGLGANPDRAANQTLSRWLEYEIRIASEEIAVLNGERAMSLRDQADASAAAPQPALIENTSDFPESHED